MKREGKGDSRRSPEASEPPHHGQDQDWVFPVQGFFCQPSVPSPSTGQDVSKYFGVAKPIVEPPLVTIRLSSTIARRGQLVYPANSARSAMGSATSPVQCWSSIEIEKVHCQAASNRESALDNAAFGGLKRIRQERDDIPEPGAKDARAASNVVRPGRLQHSGWRGRGKPLTVAEHTFILRGVRVCGLWTARC